MAKEPAALSIAPGAFDSDRLKSLIQRAKLLQSQTENGVANAELAQIIQFFTKAQSHSSPTRTTRSIDHAPLEPAQVTMLKYQMMAYQLVSKNMPIPLGLQQLALSPPILPAPTTLPNSSTSTETHSGHIVQSASATESSLPASTPAAPITNIDSYTVATEQDRRIKARLNYRISELEGLPSNLSNDSADRKLTPASDVLGSQSEASAKLRAVIELKSLRLLSKQKKLRDDIVNGVSRSTTLATAEDRQKYRLMKKQSLREAKETEAKEQQRRKERENRKREKRLQYLKTITDHGNHLLDYQENWRERQEKLGRTVLKFHEYIEKEERRRTDQISKDRINALRNDDEEAYMKLIDEAKDTRLTLLLKQTGEFLESLTKAVGAQQRDAVLQGDGEDDIMDASDPDAKNNYFQVTHRKKEEVEQPAILVGGKLKEYQLKGLQWMVSLYNNRLNGILADEMGLGKTIQTISLITYLIERKGQKGPFLIIVPLSTLTNWTLEFEKWAPSVKKIVYKGPPNARRELQTSIRYGDFQVLLTTFEYIIKDRPILSKIRWIHMIVDEGHRMKNAKSRLVETIRLHYNTNYKLILTGTPLQNNLPELWALLNFILPKVFHSVKSFEEWFNTPFTAQGVQEKVSLNEEEQLLIIKRLHKVLRPFLLRRLKKDVESELPDKVERVIKCKLSALQAKLYSQIKKHGMLFTSTGGEKGKTGIKGLNNTIMQLRKICNHPFVFEDVESVVNPNPISDIILGRVSGKFELLHRMLPKLKATGHRVLMFFQMTQIMTIMEDFMAFMNLKYLRLDGSTKADERSNMLHLFNDPNSEYFAFLLSTRAGGLGLNLQTADTVIIFDSDWNPHQDLQAQDRAHRIGQTKEVRIYRLISENTVEESILARANYKLDIDGKVIQAGKFDNRSTEEDREAFLRSLLEDKADGQDELDQEEIDEDEELNILLKRSDDDMAIFEQLDREQREKDKHQSRLIQENELPEIYRIDELPDESVDTRLEFGRGQRAKESVRYDDGLTEEQWLRAVDEGRDLSALIERKRKRRARMMEAEDDSDASSSGGRRGRRTRESSALDTADPSASTPKKRRRVATPTGLEAASPSKRGRKPAGARVPESEASPSSP